MQLNQAEIIQVLRRRANMNQGDFGAKAFGTSFESGRTKVKNLELGKQQPTLEDIKSMARVLGVSPSDMRPADADNSGNGPRAVDGALVKRQILDMFPGLEAYLDMLDKSIRIGDTELIGHIAEKIAAIFRQYKTDVRHEAATRTQG